MAEQTQTKSFAEKLGTVTPELLEQLAQALVRAESNTGALLYDAEGMIGKLHELRRLMIDKGKAVTAEDLQVFYKSLGDFRARLAAVLTAPSV